MHSTLLRLLAAAPLCALVACATADSASKAEVDSLRAELRSLRDNNSRLEQRLERLEVRDTVSRAKANAAPAPAATPAPAAKPEQPTPSLTATPELAVVKLKPRNEPAPPIATRVAVAEPAADDMEAFISGSDSEDSAAPARPRRQARGAKEVREPAERQDTAQADADYEQAVSALRTGNVEGGVARLQRFAEENPRNPRADNALYFSGLGLIGLKDFAGAARVFERLIETYPAGDAVVDGLLRLAECRQRLNQTDDARALYTRLVTQFPGTAAATQAEQRLATLSH